MPTCSPLDSSVPDAPRGNHSRSLASYFSNRLTLLSPLDSLEPTHKTHAEKRKQSFESDSTERMAVAEEVKGTGVGGPTRPPPGQNPGEVLHQTSKLPFGPMRMAVIGFAVAATIGYFTLYTKKKPEATAVDVAKVASGVSRPEDTHPRK